MTRKYIPDDPFAGDEPARTGRAYIKAGASFSIRTPLMRDETDPTTLVPWDGDLSKQAVALSARVADAPATDTLQPIYKTGCWRLSAINWPDGLNDKTKRAAFFGTPLSVDD